MRLQYPPLHSPTPQNDQQPHAQETAQARMHSHPKPETQSSVFDHASSNDFDIESGALVERIIACLPSELEDLARREAVDGWALIHTEVDVRTPGGILASFGRARTATGTGDDIHEMSVPPKVERAAAATVAVERAADSAGSADVPLVQLDPNWGDLAALQPGFDFLIHSAQIVAIFAVIALAGRVMGPGLMGRVFPILVFLRFWKWSHDGERAAAFWRDAASLARREGRREAVRWYGFNPDEAKKLHDNDVPSRSAPQESG